MTHVVFLSYHENYEEKNKQFRLITFVKKRKISTGYAHALPQLMTSTIHNQVPATNKEFSICMYFWNVFQLKCLDFAPVF